VLALGGWLWWRYWPDSLPPLVSERLARSPVANPPLYKWRDARGQWQITDRPPPDRPYEEVRVDPRQNVVPSVVPGRDKPVETP
jgi:hypothetical protein